MIEDELPQDLVERWREALDLATASLDHLRWIYPTRMLLLPETGREAIRRAKDSIEQGVAQVHRAGRYVLGAEGYEAFLRGSTDQQYEQLLREGEDG